MSWITAMASFLVAAVATSLAILAARRFNVVDHPHPDFRTHTVPTPLLGGLGILAGSTAGVLAAGQPPMLWPFLGCALLIGLGAYKDVTRRDVAPGVQLLIQAAACGLLMVKQTSTIEQAMAMVVFGVALINAHNFLDVMDGLCAAVTAILAFGFYFVTQSLPALALAGAALGFLCFNLPPARVYMGDIGSFFVGFTVFQLSVGAIAAGASKLPLMLLLALPLAELTHTVLRRAIVGRPVLQGDTSHLCLLLREAGMSVRQILMAFIVVSALLVAIASHL